jgi:hypothetical protein
MIFTFVKNFKMTFRLIIIFIIISFFEVYAFQAVRTLTKVRWVQGLYIVISLVLIGFIFFQFTKFDRSVGQTKMTMITLGLLLLVSIPKILLTLLLFIEDVFRLFSGVISHFTGTNNTDGFLPERRKFVSQIALGIASIPFFSLIYGMTIGKYNYRVIKQQIFFPDLPDAFDGFKITQISDVHSGSFDNAEKINYAIDLINQQDSDLILFTGDIVNTHAKEMHPWITIFNKIKPHAYGKYSVLGNHDYGEYVAWKTQKEKIENAEEIKDLYRQIGFKLLLNQNVKVQKGQDEIALVGVEN